MRVDGQVDLLHGVFVRPREHELVNHLGGMGTHDVGAEDLTVFGSADDLHEALGFTRSTGAPAGHEGELAHLVVDLLVLALLLREAYGRDLGMAVRRAWDV